MRGCAANWVNGAAVDEKVEVGTVGAVRVVAWRADLLARLPPAVLAADDVLVEGVIQPCATRTLPAGVDIRTQSPAPMPRAVARSGWSSTCGSGARRRRLGMLRCCVSQKSVSLAEVSTSGKRAARSGRERGETGGSSKSGSGG